MRSISSVGDAAQRLGDDLVARGEVVGRRRQRHAGLAGHGAVGHAVDAVAADEADRRLDDRGADGLGRRAADGGGHLTAHSTVVLTPRVGSRAVDLAPRVTTGACPAAASWPRAPARSCARSAASASCSASPATRRRPTPPRAACRRRASARPPRAGRGADRAADLPHAAAAAGRDGARVLDPGARRALGHRALAPAARRVARARGRRAERLPRLRLPADDRGLRRARWRRRAIPGPTLYAEVGDTIVVHFRNGLSEQTGQALTMHPHGVKYNPEYDGVFLGDFTRAGGFVRPGREFTYTWEATPDAVGVWPYHDHGPNHTLNTFRGLFGAIIVRERGAKVPDVEARALLPRARAAGHRPRAPVPVHQRPRLRRQHADAARQGRPGRRHPRDGDGQQLPRLPHPRAPLEGPQRHASSTPPPWGPTRRSPPASSRTTRAAGCTTATSSPTRTVGWRAGTWSSPKAPHEETFP